MNIFRFSFTLMITTAFITTGCGKSSTKEPLLTPTKGKVSFADGSPATGFVMKFLPMEQNSVSLEATPSNNGEFSITVLGGGKEGAVSGKFRVAFRILSDPAKSTETANAKKKIPKNMQDEDSTNLVVNIVAGNDLAVKIQNPQTRK